MDAETDRLLSQLAAYRRRVHSRLPVERMVAFGSRIRGRARPESDVDLLIVSPAYRGVRRLRRGIELYDDWNLDLPVDFLCFTPEEFEEMKERPTIVREALREGVEVEG